MANNRNSLCGCGSGIKYKHCHLKLENALDEEKLEIAKKIYAAQWSNNSIFFFDQGYYSWMAEQLIPYKPQKIFDIGTGMGHGVATLYEKFKSDSVHIVSIDENKECLSNAKANLLNLNGIDIDIYERLGVSHHGVSHTYSFSTIDYPSTSNIVLLESDVLSETKIDEIIKCSGEFDAITAWLVGSHEQRENCTQVINHSKTPGEYRLRVQNKVYELADKILRSGGVLQIVDRGEAPKEDFLRKDLLNSHSEQASVTSLKVKELEYREYEEPIMGITMEMNQGTSGRLPTNPPALISVISVKP